MDVYRRGFESRSLDYAIWGHFVRRKRPSQRHPSRIDDVLKGKEAILEFGREVARLGGCPLAEHGVGRNPVKQALLRQLYGDAGIDQMRAVKQALDPDGIASRRESSFHDGHDAKSNAARPRRGVVALFWRGLLPRGSWPGGGQRDMRRPRARRAGGAESSSQRLQHLLRRHRLPRTRRHHRRTVPAGAATRGSRSAGADRHLLPGCGSARHRRRRPRRRAGYDARAIARCDAEGRRASRPRHGVHGTGAHRLDRPDAIAADFVGASRGCRRRRGHTRPERSARIFSGL